MDLFIENFCLELYVEVATRMRYYIKILPGKNSVYGRPSCTIPLFRSGVVMMTTLDHAVEEECRSILLEEEEEEEEEEDECRRILLENKQIIYF